MKTIYVAALEGRKFTFAAYGETDSIARQAICEGIREHARQYRLPDSWAAEMCDCVTVWQATLGVPYRDLEPMQCAR